MTISTTTISKSYSGNGSTHSFAYDFPIFANADLTVIIRSSTGSETVKTLDTHYVVTGAGVSSGGTVLFKFNTGTTSDAHYSSSDFRPASGETVVIRSELANTQALNLVANDPFPAETLETNFDKVVRMIQQHDEELNRSIKISRTNTMTSTEFTTSSTDRANKLLSFNGSGELAVTQEIGTLKGNWGASTSYVVRDLVKDTSTNNIFICITAHTSSGSQPLTTNTDSAKWSLIVDAASSTTAQTAAASSATAAASSATAAATSLSTFTGQYHGAASSDPSSNLDAGDLYFKTDGTGMKVYNGSAWIDVKPTSSEQTNINTVASANSNISALAASAVITDMALLGTADVVADMALLGNADVIADMALLATSDVISDMNTLATSDIVSDLNTLATSDIVSDINTLATSDIVSDLNTLATSDIVADMNLLATSSVIADMASLAGSGANPNITSLTASGEIAAASLDISGNVDIDGTLEADAMTLNSTAITTTATLSTGISNGNVLVATSGIADDDFLRVNGTSIEGRSASEVVSDIGATTEATAEANSVALAIALG